MRIQLTLNTAPTRPLTNRYMFVVQDYVRVPSGNSGGTSDLGPCFYTYNHDIDHPYFAHRPGFLRFKVKNQGLVATLGDEGKTRLTWLANMDPGGMIPSAFVNGLLVGLMSTPFVVVEQTEEYLGVRNGCDVADLTKPSPTQVEEEEEGQGNRAVLESAAELKLKAELAEMKAEMARKDEESREREAELKRAIALKDDEMRHDLTASLAEKERELAEKDIGLKRAVEESRMKDNLLKEKDKLLAEKDKQMMELRRRLPLQ